MLINRYSGRGGDVEGGQSDCLYKDGGRNDDQH